MRKSDLYVCFGVWIEYFVGVLGLGMGKDIII